MTSGNRLALTLWLALLASVGATAPSSAQKNDPAALSAEIAELGRAGKYSQAVPLAQRLLADMEKAHGPDHRDVAASLNNLALLYGNQGRDAEAEPLYRRSLAIMEKAFGSDSAEVGAGLSNLAAVYQRQGRYADAEPLFKRSLALREKSLGREHPDVAQSLNNLATHYEKQDRHADSEPLFRRALAIYQKAAGPEHPAVATVLNNLGQVAKVQSRHAEAEPLIKRSLAIREKVLGRDHPDVARSLNNLAAIATERASLQRILAAEFPDYAALSNPLPMTAKEIQSLLSADEAMVLFAVTGKESYVIAITRESFDWKPIPRGAETLSQNVAAFRRGLDVANLGDASGKSGLFDLALAHDLYATLLGPVEMLTKDKRSLLVAPSGALTALPFHLLVTEKPPAAIPEKIDGYREAAWLLKRQAVSVLPSVSSLKSLRAFARKDHGIKPMTGFGDPLFNPAQEGSGDKRAAIKTAARSVTNAAYTDFWRGAGVDRTRLALALPQLPDTADELNAVAKDLGVAAADIHLGAEASEATVKRAPLADYGIVYFATHGLVAGDVKGLAEPSLALSIPKQPSEFDDGLLTSSEVAQLKLNADCRPAIQSPATSPAPKRCRVWRARSFTPAPAAGLALGG